MRVYALLLGLLLTLGSAFVADIAVQSAASHQAAKLVRDSTDRVTPGQVWYGGLLEPITVEARRAPAPAATLTQLDHLGLNGPCEHVIRRARALQAE